MVLMLPACSPKVYNINLSRPSQVGWKFSLTSIIAEQSQSHTLITFPGADKPQSDDRDEEFNGHLEGEGEVLAVFPNGGIQKLALTVQSLTATRGGKPVANLPTFGAKIIAGHQGDKIAISVDGQPASPAVTDVLNELILLDDDSATIQDLFGPKQPIKVGATWSVDPAAMENALKSGLGGKSNGATGVMKFASLQGSDGTESATITGDFAIVEYKPGLPSTMKLDAAGIHGTLTWTVPVGGGKGTVKFLRDLSMNLDAHGTPNDTSVKLTVRGEQKRSLTMTFH